MKKSVICQLCNFSAQTPGTFVDAMIALSRYCDDHMGLRTFCIFPETAKDKNWLRLFEKERIAFGLVPRKRNVASKIRELLNDYDPLIFHSHFSLYDLSSIFLKLSVYRRAKVVWHYHNPTPTSVLQRAKDAIRSHIIGRAVGVRSIAVGDGVYSTLVAAGFSPANLFLVRNGVNTDRFFPNKQARTAVREFFGIRDLDPTKIFLLLGWDPVRKGVDIFLKAASEAARTGTQKKLFVIVGGRDTNQFVMKCAPQLSFGQSLKVIDPVDDFASLLNAVDVLVCASRSEGLSYAVAEGLSVGKVVMCSDIPGIRELYQNVDGVWRFPAEDWRKLADLMRSYELFPETELVRLGNHNRDFVAKNQSLTRWSEEIANIYKNLLDTEDYLCEA